MRQTFQLTQISCDCLQQGEAIYRNLKTSEYSCEYIYSGSERQLEIAKMWNSDSLRILISTTIGLVGNESTMTQTVCIVGLLYNLPSIIQSIGRIRAQRRNEKSECTIFTDVNYKYKLDDAVAKSNADCEQLIGCNLLERANMGKYFKSMTMNAVNGWLFHDQGCRIASLSARLGYVHNKCQQCDRCTNTSVNRCTILRKNRINLNNTRRKEGIRLLQLMKTMCVVCNKARCEGSCVVGGIQLGRRKGSYVCFKCLGPHLSRDCRKAYQIALTNKACYRCFQYNYCDEVRHDFSVCKDDGGIKDRLKALIQHDFCDKNEHLRKEDKISFSSHVSGIYASADTFFAFLYRYRNRM